MAQTPLPVTILTCALLLACQRPAKRQATSTDAGATLDTAADTGLLEEDATSLSRRGTISVPYQPSAWISGTTTRARFGLTSVQTRHEGPFGRSRIEMEYTDGSGRPPRLHEQFGRWRLFGYLPERRSYIVAGAWEQGAFEPYGAMAYLDEATGVVRHWQDERSWYAFAAVPSPDLHFIALVGPLDGGYRVLLWNTVSDRLFDVAQAPAPPPMSAFDCEQYASPEGFWWGMPVDAVVDLDPGIISFTNTHLEVSYGRDTCRMRAERRVRRKWPLKKFAAAR